MFRTPRLRRARTPRLFAMAAGVLLAATVGFYVDAATTTKPYSATWFNGASTVANPPNTLSVSGSTTSVKLQLQNWASQQVLGSANITAPAGYTLGSGSLNGAGNATVVGSTLQLRNLALAPGATVDVTIGVTVGCGASGTQAWSLRVKQSNDFSGNPGNDFSLKSGTAAPSTSSSGGTCSLRFATTPGTTRTGAILRSGYDSTGDPIKVEIYDPSTNAVVNSSAPVTISLYGSPSGVVLSGGGTVNAVNGVATFGSMTINLAGAYRLQASSPAASNSPLTPTFIVADTVTTCADISCDFTQQQGRNSYNVDPTTGDPGATYTGALNMAGLDLSCEGAPWYYPKSRQPNTVWFNYSGGSTKVVTIVIDKKIVQETSENGASFYRVCFTAPYQFQARDGLMAQADASVTAYFGGVTTWYTGLLPDCTAVSDQAPCVISWTGGPGGDRVGTFLAPAGDPGFY